MSTTDDNHGQQCGSSGEKKSSKKECISCEQNNVDNITEVIDSVSILDDKSTCAACGKEGSSDDMNTCNKCKMVKYCNAVCKKKHRTKHKKKCDRRVAELHDEQLFKEVEPDECPICLLPMPTVNQTTVKSCCGKRICNGCVVAMKMSEGKDLCAFCRSPRASSGEEEIERTKSLMDNGNGEGCLLLASYYDRGVPGLLQDYQKANELWLKAGELGCSIGCAGAAYYNLGNSYLNGRGVERDLNRAKYYWELSAMNGNLNARTNLGLEELKKGNIHRAMKHWIIAARAGCKKSLDIIKECFMRGDVTKEEYASTLRAYQKRQNEMKSDERDQANAAYSHIDALTQGR